MKISESWLKEWADPGLGTEELAEQLTMAGFEVDGVESCAAAFDRVVVGRITGIESHPDADNLSVCDVSTGDTSLAVVTGAKNIAEGRCYALAVPGATLPGGIEISESEFRGVTSSGMLCSAQELGLSADADKLFELHPDAVPGTDLAEHLGMEDHVLDLSLTPNRGDSFSVSGIAREVAVLNELSLSAPDIESLKAGISDERPVRLDCPEACPRYVGRIIKGIDITARAPDWVLERLRRSDVKSINAVVDLTNYVMLELGQPMHAFDNEKLTGEIVVRMPQPSERLTLLDGQDCEIAMDTLLISDDSGPLALAGIIGGLDSAVSDTTSEIFLESAYFTAAAVAGRARRYGLHTDASLRYERGVDYALQEKAVERLSSLILRYCGGSAGPVVTTQSSEHVPQPAAIRLQPRNIERLLGISVETGKVQQILESLGMEVVKDGDCLQVTSPSFRFDISIEADLVEEVARIYGYDNIPSSSPRAGLSMFGNSSDDRLRELQACLLNRGYNEVITYSFLEQQEQEKLLGKVDAIALLNPISTDLGVMRVSLIPGLLSALAYNHNRQQDRIRLFEWGRIFRQGEEIEQDLMIAGIITGNNHLKQWDREDTSSDFYDIKGDLETLLYPDDLENRLEYREINHPALHPGQSAEVCLENQVIGCVGSIHPALAGAYGLPGSVLVFELNLSLISEKPTVKYAKFSKYPSIRRDISIVLDKEIALGSVKKSIREVADSLLSNLELFDLYEGEGIDPMKKSLALGLTFQASSSTLTEEEVERVLSQVLDTLYKTFGATLRD